MLLATSSAASHNRKRAMALLLPTRKPKEPVTMAAIVSLGCAAERFC